MNDPIGEGQYTRIMRDDEHRATWLFGNIGQNAHDGPTVLTVQSSRRFIRQNDRCIPGDGTRNGNALLFAAAELRGKDLSL